ncbi:methyl-accepting chemotaxis protein [Hathewaya limosa]|uniref:Methyl-accepting chemotaxis protein n=1 Tax=Hathewaya limosa TaxID=1536 RepID=A0ABU0JRH8_HATLI|nr:methyl-accepting chemotaxis protein [Hathewaya limosa]MDQ0479670.1 methyl-accepting chemotaxis protein [Hathewaya limosa]
MKDTKNINKVNVKIFIVYTICQLLYDIIYFSASNSKIRIFLSLISIGICGLPLWIKTLEKYSQYVISIGILFFIFVFTYIDGFSNLTLLSFPIVINVCNLYNDERASLVVGSLSSIYLFVSYVFLKDKLYSQSYKFINLKHIVTYSILIFIAGFISYLQCKKNNNILKLATDKTKLAQNESEKNLGVLNNIQNASEEVEVFVADLEDECNETISIGEEISRHTKKICENLASQSESMNKTLEFFTELVDTFEQSSGNFKNIEENIIKTKKVCGDNELYVDGLTNKIQNINIAVKEVMELINNINKHNEGIEEILKVLRGISKQTNILSLNASIEAERAGEFGKGFSVVAAQVKKLSNDSTKHADEIEDYLKSIKLNANKAKIASEKCSMEVTDGIDDVENVIKSFDSIYNSVGLIDDSSKGLSQKIDNLSVKINYLDDELKEIASHVEESNSFIDNVVSLIQSQFKKINMFKNNLQDILKKFKHLKNLYK